MSVIDGVIIRAAVDCHVRAAVFDRIVAVKSANGDKRTAVGNGIVVFGGVYQRVVDGVLNVKNGICQICDALDIKSRKSCPAFDCQFVIADSDYAIQTVNLA